MEQYNENRKGDKVLILRGDYQGQRGIIDDIQDGEVRVILPETVAELPFDCVQNFSLAARKAWQTRPNRAAGRPKDPSLPAKRMISLRLEAKLWDEIGRAVELGIIHSRESIVNEWLREKLAELWISFDKNKDGGE